MSPLNDLNFTIMNLLCSIKLISCVFIDFVLLISTCKLSCQTKVVE